VHDLTVTHELVGSLRTYRKNPRRGDLPKIKASLSVNGQYKPIVVNRGTHTNRPREVLAGNHTLMAARDLGWPTIAACWVDVDDDQAARIVAADNRTADLGGYDDAELADLLRGLPDLDGTGYDDEDLAALLAPATNDPDMDSAPPRPTLTERFGVPPFTVLDARQGYWQDRKRTWIALGLSSEVGRDAELLGGFANAATTKAKFEGRDVTTWGHSGTSIFDPVLTELLVRWYSTPKARVLDPFAGGSVRGIVSACLDRQYTGIDLRAEQVEANRDQASTILASTSRLGGGSDYTPAMTPVERHGEYLVKRDDAWNRDGASGAKSRVMFRIASAADAGIITVGVRRSPQIERAALTAQAIGIPCRVHVPDGKDTPEIETCRAAGAEVIKHSNGRLTVLRARFRDDVARHPGWVAVPFGMGIDAYAEDVAAQVANIPDGVIRIVVPCGSGMTAAGILRGLDAQGRDDVRVVGVVLGHDPAEYLDTFAGKGWRDRVDLVKSEQDFEDDASVATLGSLNLDPMYEAKCLPHLQPGDLLWCVGIRRSAPPNPVPGTVVEPPPAPRWITGDSRNLRDLVDDDQPYDLMLTCPPYFDLEVYSGDPADLSRCGDYETFLADYAACLGAASDRMASNAFAAIVTGAVRDKRGYIQDLPADTTRIMATLGWRLYQDAILVTNTGTAAIRADRAFSPTRKLTRTHQAVGIYHRGDIAAVRSWPSCEVGAVADDPSAEC